MTPKPALTKLGILGGVTLLVLAGAWSPAAAQNAPELPNSPGPAPAAASQPATPTGPSITLDEALARARANEPTFAAAVAASKTAALDKSIARSALLPTVVYHNSYIYTQPNGATNQAGSTGAQSAPKFVANNTVHEYYSQAQVNETIGLAQTTAASRASAEAAIAAAEMEIARRGLTATVIQLFYGVTTALTKVTVEQRATTEARDFVKQTQLREEAREAAHADVIKAQLTLQQRQRDLDNAKLQADKARLDLGVLLFPDPRSPYTAVPAAASPLADRAAIESAAAANNAELKSALATLRSKDEPWRRRAESPPASRGAGSRASPRPEYPTWRMPRSRDCGRRPRR